MNMDERASSNGFAKRNSPVVVRAGINHKSLP